MDYQDINFKISLSLFGWKENILYKQHCRQKMTSKDNWQRYYERKYPQKPKTLYVHGLVAEYVILWKS